MQTLQVEGLRWTGVPTIHVNMSDRSIEEMAKAIKEAIRANYPDITENVPWDTVKAYLYRDKLITEQNAKDWDSIQSLSSKNKMDRAMESVSSLGEKDLVERFPHFLSILHTANLDHLATKLEQATGKEICSYILSCLIVL